MAYNNIIGSQVWRLLLIFLVTIPVLSKYSSCIVNGEPKVPCFFIYGDSLADNGNNNFLLTLAKANFSPYGIDFPIGATGRFTNNQTTVDIIAELLGFERSIPPFATAVLNGDITNGVNYASASAGIRDETGKNIGDNISFNRQLLNHRTTISRLKQLFGNTTVTKNYLNKCLYSLGFGSNDYLNNYFLPFSPTSSLFTPQQYATALITQYETQIRSLYKIGAKKMVVNGIGQIGCTPYAITRFGNNMSACVDRFNDAVQLFNDQLLSLVIRLNNDLVDAKIIYIDFYRMLSNLDPAAAAAFKVKSKSCCQTQIGGTCIINGIPCQNRNEYIFYDEFHPTDAANRLTAIRSYTASDPSDVYPYDISHLVAL